MNYYWIILFILGATFVVEGILAYINNRNRFENIPELAQGIYDIQEYQKFQKYEAVKFQFHIWESAISFMIMFIAIFFGFFGVLDNWLHNFFHSELTVGLVFFAIVIFAQIVFSLPFSYYETFSIEQKFGFNKMTKKLFIRDTIVSLLLTFILGGIIYSVIFYLYSYLGKNFWIAAWITLSVFTIFMTMLYSTLIVPLYNKQTPLEEGELRREIQKFADSVGFVIDDIFVMDGSKRSTKANAYFSGFGPKKRIVLFDTLIKDFSTRELVAILAHEIGHYKKKHILQMLVFTTLQTGVLLYIFSFFLGNQDLATALGAQNPSFHILIFAFGILFTPISLIVSIAGNVLSRKNEYEADAFAREYYDANELANALKKLSKNNFANLTPHPMYEFFYYSHPNVLRRLAALTTPKQ